MGRKRLRFGFFVVLSLVLLAAGPVSAHAVGIARPIAGAGLGGSGVVDLTGVTGGSVTARLSLGVSPLVVPTFSATPTVVMVVSGQTVDIEHPPPGQIYWTNSLTPEMDFSTAGDTGTPVIRGFYYVVDRSAFTIPDTDSDFTPVGSPITKKTLDLEGLAQRFPSPLINGVSVPVEGAWGIHVRSFNDTAGLTDKTAQARFGIDVTKPAAIQGLTTDVSGWTTVYRHRLQWVDKAYERWGPGQPGWRRPGYDALSGDKGWVLRVNRGAPISWDRSTLTPLASVTIENGLHEGKNTVQIQVEDVPGNLSAPVNAYIYLDQSLPTVSIKTPASTGWMHGVYKFSVKATDAAGIRSIAFRIDGVTRQSSTSSAMSFDTRRLAAGSHTLQVIVRDMFGHTASASRSFKVDNSPVAITSLSGGPNPFYPIIHDGFKDIFTVTFHTSETATDMYLRIWSGKTLYREQHYVNVGADTIALSWNGASSAGTIARGTFSYQVVAYDRARNVAATGLHTVTATTGIFLVPVGPGAVKVVRR